MTCYMHHLAWLFASLGLPYEASERARVDAAIRDTLSIRASARCPQVWAAVKALDDDGRAVLAAGVAERLGQDRPATDS